MNRKIKYLTLVICIVFPLLLVPSGKCTSGNVYLSLGGTKTLHFTVHNGDILAVNWDTSPYFDIAVAYEFTDIVGAGILWYGYTTGIDCKVSITCPSGSHGINIIFINVDIISGYLNYNVYIEKCTAEETQTIFIIIGVVVAILGGITALGIVLYVKLKRKEKRKIEAENNV